MAGPTTDYGYTSFGSDVTTPGYVGEDGTAGNLRRERQLHVHLPARHSGRCHRNLRHRRGIRAAGERSGRTPTRPSRWKAERRIRSSTSPWTARRCSRAAPWWRETNCNQCHVHLTLHGNRRNDPQYCVLCHNPSDTDFLANASPRGQSGADHQLRSHGSPHSRRRERRSRLAARPYIVAGFGGSTARFLRRAFPGHEPNRQTPPICKTARCATSTAASRICRIGTESGHRSARLDQSGAAPSSACSGCHVSKPEASHFLANTNSLGESCTVCHAAGAQFAVDAEHAQ